MLHVALDDATLDPAAQLEREVRLATNSDLLGAPLEQGVEGAGARYGPPTAALSADLGPPLTESVWVEPYPDDALGLRGPGAAE